jgi:hypothetical protein
MKQIIDFLSNQNLSTIENFIIWVNVFFASFSGWFAFKASKMGIYGLRNSFKLISGMAWLYTVSYGILLISDINFLSWSSIMRGVSIFAWAIVWILPAYTSIKLWKKLEKNVTETLREIEADE